jgi:hypothetical protein
MTISQALRGDQRRGTTRRERFDAHAFRESVDGIINTRAFLRWASVNLLLRGCGNYFATTSNYYLCDTGRLGAEHDFMRSLSPAGNSPTTRSAGATAGGTSFGAVRRRSMASSSACRGPACDGNRSGFGRRPRTLPTARPSPAAMRTLPRQRALIASGADARRHL